MKIRYKPLLKKLDAKSDRERLAAVTLLSKIIESGGLEEPLRSKITNNHIHTRYSFSPYSPSSAVWHGYMAGLASVGIMDHDSLAGAKEFIEAGRAVGIPTTIGYEIRTDWSDTKVAGRRINNPDQISSAYITTHGVPHDKIDEAEAFLAPIRAARNERNLKEVDKINEIMKPHGIKLDFERDVVPISYARFGGSITERHLLFALVKRMIAAKGRGARLINFMQHDLGISLSKKQTDYLLEVKSGMYNYDVLNILKGSFVDKIYIETTPDETVPVRQAVDFAKSINAIASYCYLGDVGDSPTGDKKAQKFEDSYLDELMQECADIGFNAVSVMPSRNTDEQLMRVMSLCEKYGFMPISGEDINQPRQNFICEELGREEFSRLIDTTWALIGHEIAATRASGDKMFGDRRPTSGELDELIEKYMKIAKE
jgi:hypothetical protein